MGDHVKYTGEGISFASEDTYSKLKVPCHTDSMRVHLDYVQWPPKVTVQKITSLLFLTSEES